MDVVAFPAKAPENVGAVTVPEKLPVVAPVIAPLIFPVPLKLCPQIVLAFCSFVAVEAFPVKEPRNVPVALTSPETSSL